MWSCLLVGLVKHLSKVQLCCLMVMFRINRFLLPFLAVIDPNSFGLVFNMSLLRLYMIVFNE